MRTTVGHMHDAGIALAAIFNRPRKLPQSAKYKLAKLHKAISPLADAAEKRRHEIVLALGAEKKDPTTGETTGWEEEVGPDVRATRN